MVIPINLRVNNMWNIRMKFFERESAWYLETVGIRMMLDDKYWNLW